MNYKIGPRQLNSTVTGTLTTMSATFSTANTSTTTPLPVLNKVEGHANYKLTRSCSVDYDDVEVQQQSSGPQSAPLPLTPQQIQQTQQQSSLPPPHIIIGQANNVRRITLLERLQEDESAPLVFNIPK